MDRYADLFFKGGYQLISSHRLEKSGHVLDAQHVSASLLQFLSHFHIVFQVVFSSRFV